MKQLLRTAGLYVALFTIWAGCCVLLGWYRVRAFFSNKETVK